jgi:hypothetical protein
MRWDLESGNGGVVDRRKGFLDSPPHPDFRNIIDWTLDQFGDKQALVYA